MFHMSAAQQHAPALNALGIIAEEGQGGCEKDLKARDPPPRCDHPSATYPTDRAATHARCAVRLPQVAWQCYRLAALHGSAEAEANLRSLEDALESSQVEQALCRDGPIAGCSSSIDPYDPVNSPAGKVETAQCRGPLKLLCIRDVAATAEIASFVLNQNALLFACRGSRWWKPSLWPIRACPAAKNNIRSRSI
jgi:TPR repeat protein